MAIELTLLIVKPDGVRRGLVGEVLRRVEAKGLTIEQLDLRVIERAVAEEHYGEHRDKPFFGELVDFITSGPTLAFVLEGEGVIATARTTIGATNPADAVPGSLRGDFAAAMPDNLVHGSDSPESAVREIALWFPDGLV
jgi:nucleoside-diphosphate kinase